MSDSCVNLVLRISHVRKYTPDLQDIESLALGHSERNTDFMDRH